MATGSAVSKGISVSFNNTPQASDDFFTAGLDGLTEDNLGQHAPVILDVMANDAGGNSKSLYSLDDGVNSTGTSGDLLQQDAVGAANRSLHGATIKITADGKVSYDASTMDASFVTDLQHLAAGEFATDSFTYAIRLGNGTLSWATATVQIAGVNDAPAISGPVTGNATEDGPAVTLDALTHATDVDHDDALSVTNVQPLPAGVSYDAAAHAFTLDPSNAAYQHLAQGQTTTVTANYGVTDGMATTTASASWIVTGTNDAPVVSAAVTGMATEDGPSSALNALARASDVDDGTVLSVTALPASLPAGVTYDAAAHAFTLDPSNAAYQHLAQGETTTVTANYGVTDGIANTAASASWIVTGTNDAPFAFVDQVSETEDTLPNPVSGNVLANDTDVDTTDTHSVTAVNGSAANVGQDIFGTYGTLRLNADGSYAYVLDNTKSSMQALAQGQTVQDIFAYTNSDNHGATSSSALTINVAGSNDAPVLQAPIASDPVLANDSLTVIDTLVFADLDLTDKHSTTFSPQGTGYVGDFQSVVTTDANGHGSITTTYHLTKAQVEANGGAFPDHQDYLVTIDDGHGGTASQLVDIPLGTILSGVGGGGGGGGTTVDPPVFLNSSPPGSFAVGHDFGQITDNPFVLDPSVANSPSPTFLPDSTYLFAQGTLNFSDPDGGFHQASVDLAHAQIVAHWITDSSGVRHPAPDAPPVSTTAGIWEVNVQDPGQVHWTYALPEAAVRSMTSGEGETIIAPITISEDGVGQSTENVRIDLIGTDEPTSMLAPNIVLTANTDITPYLLPIDQATHVQTLNYSISEDPLVTGSTSHHTLTGSIAYVDPDVLNRPTVTMTVADMTHSLDANPGDAAFNAAVQPLMAGFSYSVQSFGNYGMINWTYDVQDSALDFLSQGSSLTASANFSVGTQVGGAFTTVNVNLQGANDAPVIPGSNTTSVDVALHNSLAGSFTVTDPDWYPDGHSVQFVPLTPPTHGNIFGGTPVETGQGGSEPISWNYIADFGPGTLVAGQHDIWNVVVQDHFGAVATHTLDFHLV